VAAVRFTGVDRGLTAGARRGDAVVRRRAHEVAVRVAGVEVREKSNTVTLTSPSAPTVLATVSLNWSTFVLLERYVRPATGGSQSGGGGVVLSSG
jgi:hypothetical protein